MQQPQKTLIDSFLDEKEETRFESKLDPVNDILNLSLESKIRLSLLNNLIVSQKNEDIIEVLNKLCSMYENSRVSSIRKFFFEILEQTNLDDNFKLNIVYSLYNCNSGDDLVFNFFVKLALSEAINVFQRIAIVKILMNNKNFYNEAQSLFEKVLKTTKITSENKLKTILSLEKEIDNWIQFSSFACLSFYKDTNNNIRHRLLAIQFLLSKCQKACNENEIKSIFEELLCIAKNENELYNTRADSTDLLLKFSSNETLNEARNIIKELGKKGRIEGEKGFGFYGNAQNVHTSEISDSVEKSIEKLQSYDILKVNNNLINIDYIQKEIFVFIDENKLGFDKEKIMIALNRISMDNSFYGQTNATLSLVLLKTWSFIIHHEHSNEIKKRLCEELELTFDLCSSGFLTGIINSLSSYGFEMKISWRDQIISNFSGRLNKRIRDMDNLRLQGLILEEMTFDTTETDKRKHLLKFLRQNMSDIREELYDEFKTLVTDTDFDIYFRNAVSEYETGSYI